MSSTPAEPCLSCAASSAAFVKWTCSPVPNDKPLSENTAPLSVRLPVTVPPVLSSFLSSSAFTALFCTGFSDSAEMASSTTVLFAPASTPSSFVLSEADIRPAADCTATAVLALPFNAAVITLFCTGFSDVVDKAASTVMLAPPVISLMALAISPILYFVLAPVFLRIASAILFTLDSS